MGHPNNATVWAETVLQQLELAHVTALKIANHKWLLYTILLQNRLRLVQFAATRTKKAKVVFRAPQHLVVVRCAPTLQRQFEIPMFKSEMVVADPEKPIMGFAEFVDDTVHFENLRQLLVALRDHE